MQNVPISASPLSVMTAVNFSESKISTNPSERRTLSLDISIGCSTIQTVGQGEANV
ncbi:MAG: hypothetical protein GQ571_06045 [Desulfobacterales bacterium]|nr:hypothetical protein [Desulfobacterales bacterium]